MALQAVVTQQGELVLSDADQVVIGDADAVVVLRPVWGGQSPGSTWHEWEAEEVAELVAVG